MLRTQAVYEVVAVERDNAVVSVIEAPGLRAGERLRLALCAVAAMEVAGMRRAAAAVPQRVTALRRI
jgi:hypothetical protein